MRTVSIVAVLAALVLAAGAQSGVEPTGSTWLHAYRGSGSWVSIYDTKAWRAPEAVVATLAAHHVGTLYLETGNARQKVDVVRPEVVGRFVDAAHAAGIDVVGWYVPSFANNAKDVRRSLAGARFESSTGSHFDGFALDIESTTIRWIPRRTRRAVAFATAVHAALPARYPLGAITIDPVGARYWPGYPFAALARTVQVFLPMAYFTARTSGARHVRAYSAANIEEIRRLVHDPSFPIHPIGGETRRASLAELRAFFDASDACKTLGSSLWEYGQTRPSQWALLASR